VSGDAVRSWKEDSSDCKLEKGERIGGRGGTAHIAMQGRGGMLRLDGNAGKNGEQSCSKRNRVGGGKKPRRESVEGGTAIAQNSTSKNTSRKGLALHF